MQTFMPCSSFLASLMCLDQKRLGCQRKEALQILQTLIKCQENPSGKIGWRNHPAVLQWKNHIPALIQYGILCCNLWIGKGFSDSCLPQFIEISKKLNIDITSDCEKPPFMGDERYHSSHRANLLRKAAKSNSSFYQAMGWTESIDMPYFWPSKHVYK